MKVTLDIPDKYLAANHIYILAGRQLIFYKYLDPASWMKKVSECNLCGKCCQNFRSMVNDEYIDVNGHCTKLKPDGNMLRCGKELDVPFSCIIGVGPYRKIPECTEKFEPVK